MPERSDERLIQMHDYYEFIYRHCVYKDSNSAMRRLNTRMTFDIYVWIWLLLYYCTYQSRDNCNIDNINNNNIKSSYRTAIHQVSEHLNKPPIPRNEAILC